MFAGPNGSGKSSLKDVLDPSLIGTYVNSDEIERQLTSSAGLPLTQLPFDLSHDVLQLELLASPYLRDADAKLMRIQDQFIFLDAPQAGYYAAALSDIFRRRLLDAGSSFSFETVMSHPSKVDLLRSARASGYRTYLYFVATETVSINVSRVASRVALGGHDVPEDKIRERYTRSLDLLPDAIQATNRAYIFDNSTENRDRVLIAEFTDGTTITLHVDEQELPGWFVRSVYDHIKPS